MVVPLGTKLIISIKIVSDVDLEHVHISDYRPSGTEPEDVLSGMEYSSGLSYFRTISDSSEEMFAESLPKGTYEFKIPVIATVPGIFSSGYTKVYPMYSPEYASHSSGGTIIIDQNKNRLR